MLVSGTILRILLYLLRSIIIIVKMWGEWCDSDITEDPKVLN